MSAVTEAGQSKHLTDKARADLLANLRELFHLDPRSEAELMAWLASVVEMSQQRPEWFEP